MATTNTMEIDGLVAAVVARARRVPSSTDGDSFAAIVRDMQAWRRDQIARHGRAVARARCLAVVARLEAEADTNMLGLALSGLRL